MGRMPNPTRNKGLRPQLSAVRPTSRANGNSTSCAATMQVDIMAVASSGYAAASFCPTSGSSGGIGKMEQHGAQPEDDQRSGLEQDTVASDPGGAHRRARLGLQVSRPVVIDGLG